MIWNKLGLGKNKKFMECRLRINRWITNNFTCSHVQNYELFDGL